MVKTADVGARVSRGPDWKWGDQDGGPGKKGTVLALAEAGWGKIMHGNSFHEACFAVSVQWENGNKNSYRSAFGLCCFLIECVA